MRVDRPSRPLPLAAGLGAALLGAALLGAAPAGQPDPEDMPARTLETLEDLMARLRTMTAFEARFVETKTLALLAKPLVTEGRMVFRAPDRLVRVVERPGPSRVIVSPDRLVTVVGGAVETLDLSARPEVRALVTSLLSFLRGDLPALEAAYRTEYRRSEDRWRLVLTPRSPRVAALLVALELEGRGLALERFVIRESSGDIATTEVHDAELGRVLDEREARALFEAP